MVTVDTAQMTDTVPFKGLSTDTKPTTYNGKVIPNGSSFFAMDTQEVFFFDGGTETWLPQP